MLLLLLLLLLLVTTASFVLARHAWERGECGGKVGGEKEHIIRFCRQRFNAFNSLRYVTYKVPLLSRRLCGQSITPFQPPHPYSPSFLPTSTQPVHMPSTQKRTKRKANRMACESPSTPIAASFFKAWHSAPVCTRAPSRATQADEQ